MIRPAVYSGTWYPSDRKEIEEYFVPGEKKVEALAAVCPHAGWLYSGKTAGLVYSRLKPAKLYVLVGPNHHGMVTPVSVFPEGEWHTPLGPLAVDNKTAAAIIAGSKYAKADAGAHMREHSLEVQMPFIKLLSPGARIVPICLYDYGPEICADLGAAISKAVKSSYGAGEVTLIASSDMSHYIPADRARKADNMAIEKILDLDPDGLLETVSSNRISMCGSGPVAIVLHAAKHLGASKAKLIAYSTSGDVTGDNSEVVGYAGLIIS